MINAPDDDSGVGCGLCPVFTDPAILLAGLAKHTVPALSQSILIINVHLNDSPWLIIGTLWSPTSV